MRSHTVRVVVIFGQYGRGDGLDLPPESLPNGPMLGGRMVEEDFSSYESEGNHRTLVRATVELDQPRHTSVHDLSTMLCRLERVSTVGINR